MNTIQCFILYLHLCYEVGNLRYEKDEKKFVHSSTLWFNDPASGDK